MPQPNKDKNLLIKIAEQEYARYPVRTHIVKIGDPIVDTIAKYTTDYLEEGDAVFISEKIIAIMQGRSYPIKSIKVSFWAKFFAKYVLKTPYGIGLGSPWTMELAIREAGLWRIFLGAIAAIITKPFGLRGVFYKVVGHGVNAIDGPCDYTLPPYNEYAKLPPKEPEKVARQIAEKIGHQTVIIDANDLGVEVLGISAGTIGRDLARKIFKDNPLGQTDEQTPICIVRTKKI